MAMAGSSSRPTPDALHAVALFLPALSGGGAERVMLHLARGLHAQGLTVHLVLGRLAGPLVTELPPGVGVVELNRSNPLTKLWALCRYLRRSRPAAMITALDHLNLAGCARALAGVPTRIIGTVHNHLSTQLARENPLKARVRAWLMRTLYPMHDAIVAVSRGVADDLAALVSLPPDRIQVIYNPIVTPELLDIAHQRPPHPWLEDASTPVVLAAGRFHPQKDFGTLLHAFALVRRQVSCRLMILGEGTHRPAISALVGQLRLTDHVAMPGFVANISSCMARASLFVLSSAYEGFGNVLVEAMAVGCPVVSTDCPSGPAEILDNGRFGRLTPVGDAYALADAIIATLRKPTDSCLLKNRAMNFTVERAVRAYLDLLTLGSLDHPPFHQAPVPAGAKTI